MSQIEAEPSSPLALSILELLDEEPIHPYEMASRMRARHHDEFIRLNFGTLYHTVEVLERNGWIHPVEREKEGRRPERTVYELEQRAIALDAIVTKFETVLRELLKQGVARLALIEVEHKIAMLDAERKWVRQLEREITEGRLEWKVGIDSGHEALRRKHGPSAH